MIHTAALQKPQRVVVLGAGLLHRLGWGPVTQLVGDLLPSRAGRGHAFGLFRAMPGVESGGHVNILSTHRAEFDRSRESG